jgi:hypothetical protein
MNAHLVNRDGGQRQVVSLKRPVSGARSFHNRLASTYSAHYKLSCVWDSVVVTLLFVLGVSGLLFGLKFQIYSRVYFFSALLRNAIAPICIMKTCRRNRGMAPLVLNVGDRLS